jgi:hypothetical protein
VIESQPAGVEAVPPFAGQRRVGSRDAPRDVEGIADQRVAGGGEVDADLVGTAGGYPHHDDRMVVADLQYRHVGDRGLALGGRGIHAA